MKLGNGRKENNEKERRREAEGKKWRGNRGGQLAARGTKERARLGWPCFGRDFLLENYDVS